MELAALVDLLRSKGVRVYEGPVEFYDPDCPPSKDAHVRLELADDVPLVISAPTSSPTMTSTADIERELAEEAKRPKDALALAMTAGNDHGGEE